jgi:hypothetical protein
MKLLFVLFLSLAAARAQGDFHAYPGTTNLTEGGTVDKITVVNSNLMFDIRPPKGWTKMVDEAGQKIVFTSASGTSAVTVQFTANSPGTLPERGILREQAQKQHPGAGISHGAICATSYKPGVFFDLVAVPTPGIVLRTRHAFVSQPAGEVEFVLTTSDADFGKDSAVFMAMLRAFRVDQIKPKSQ